MIYRTAPDSRSEIPSTQNHCLLQCSTFTSFQKCSETDLKSIAIVYSILYNLGDENKKGRNRMSHIGNDIAVETAHEALLEELGREPTDDELTDWMAEKSDYYAYEVKEIGEGA